MARSCLSSYLTVPTPVYLGKDKHILTFPIQDGKILNVVAFASDRTLSPDDPVWDSDNWIVDSTEEEMLTGWDGWSDDCLTIMKVPCF